MPARGWSDVSVVAREGEAVRKHVRLEHDQRRASILAVARRLFCDRPYAEVSMVDLAAEAGVARGLLNHYFGSKRELYLEVIRQMAQLPALPLPDIDPDVPVARTWAAAVDAWMDLIEANRDVWLLAIGAGGTGRDAELEAILNEARELVATRVLEVLRLDREPVSPSLRALVRGYGGLAEEITREWLDRGRLSREQARTLLVAALPLLIDDALPAVERAGGEPGGAHG